MRIDLDIAFQCSPRRYIVHFSTSISRMNSSDVRKSNNVGDERHKSCLFYSRCLDRGRYYAVQEKEQNGLWRCILQKSSTPPRDTLQTFPQDQHCSLTSTWPDANKSITETTKKRLTEGTSSLIYSKFSENTMIISSKPAGKQKVTGF